MGPASNQAYTVMLTGSTGSLGPYLLDNLVQNQCVEKIFCLNRSESGRDKQHQDSASRGLPTEWGQDRVVFLQADLSKPDFGLEGKAYQELLGRVTHIIRRIYDAVQWGLSLIATHAQIISGQSTSIGPFPPSNPRYAACAICSTFVSLLVPRV